ncbi:MAG: hypothetical protein JW787_04375 [Sedimentisphaerales bacterium]|nr:hypothetical protein [Sedimentisphaerales bacterium]
MSIVKDSLKFCSVFEGELLVELMLRYWKHPLAEDVEFRNALLENAAKALRLSIEGTNLIEGLPPNYMSFIAALWYVEWSFLQNASADEIQESELQQREAWLNAVQHAVPSCFCNPNDLP